MAAIKLLEEARSAGLRLRAEGDRLVIRGPRSAERIAKVLLDHKAEVLPFLREPPDAIWCCPHCGRPATIDDVGLALDRQRWLTFWSCRPCGVMGATPSDVREPPSAWVRKVRQ